MDNTDKNITLLDNFIENQRRARLWTIVSVAIFVLMALVILFYSRKLAKTEGKLSLSEKQLQVANEKLTAQNKTLDSLNEILFRQSDSVITENTGLSLSLEKNNELADSVKLLKDTLTVLLNKSLQPYLNQGIAANDKVNELYQQAFPGTAKEPSRVIMEQITKSTEIQHQAPAISIAIRYSNNYEGVAYDIFKRYNNRYGATQSPEEVKGGNFNPTVKYFSDVDRNMALRIANKLNEEYGQKFDQPFDIQLVDVKNNAGNFEIWLGKYIKRNFQVELQQNKLIRMNRQ
ncbi:MAG: hypothetical protein NTW29_15055 [Bacteroidetes bacterium]|nr:hypothetical protein [Bacteroidota bacterium]